MTEKRFILHEHDYYGDAIEDTMTDDWLDSAYQYTNKLNELSEENEQLKERIKELEKEVNVLSDGEADWLIEEEL